MQCGSEAQATWMALLVHGGGAWCGMVFPKVEVVRWADAAGVAVKLIDGSTDCAVVEALVAQEEPQQEWRPMNGGEDPCLWYAYTVFPKAAVQPANPTE
jgi:hypothetical protein